MRASPLVQRRARPPVFHGRRHLGKPPNELQVALIAGRKLKIMDTANMFSKGGGSTDALAKFTVGGEGVLD